MGKSVFWTGICQWFEESCVSCHSTRFEAPAPRTAKNSNRHPRPLEFATLQGAILLSCATLLPKSPASVSSGAIWFHFTPNGLSKCSVLRSVLFVLVILPAAKRRGVTFALASKKCRKSRLTRIFKGFAWCRLAFYVSYRGGSVSCVTVLPERLPDFPDISLVFRKENARKMSRFSFRTIFCNPPPPIAFTTDRSIVLS